MCRADLNFEVHFGVNGAIGKIVTKWDLIVFGKCIVFIHNENPPEELILHIFFGNLVSAGYLPRISLPTRVTDHSATLIDNIFSTVLDDSKSGEIINNISDH